MSSTSESDVSASYGPQMKKLKTSENTDDGKVEESDSSKASEPEVKDKDHCDSSSDVGAESCSVEKDHQETLKATEEISNYQKETITKDIGEGSSRKKTYDVAVEYMNTNIDEIRSLAVNLGHRRDDKAQDCNIICKFFKFLLELWGTKLNEREEEEKTSTAGKIESQTYTQTQAYLKPLFKQLKRIKIADDILKHLTLIVKYTLDRDYVQANEAYLRMAIGNAPWPIGVTMVGIHARTGREKIFSQNIAHVMNDETQRKYIQGLKRLITKCQQYFPADPSRCVEYKALG